MKSLKSVMKIMMVMTLAAGVAFAGSHAVVAAPLDPGEFDVTSTPDKKGYNSGEGGNSSIVTECENSQGSKMSFADFMQAQDDLYQSKKSDPDVILSNPGTMMCTATVVPAPKVNEISPAAVPITSTVLGLGDLTSICDTSTQVSLTFNIDVAFGAPQVGEIKRNYTTTPSNIKVASSGYQFCTWNMVFKDAKKSRLSGTVESTATINAKKASLSTKCENYPSFVAFCYLYSKSSNATVVGGSGYYEGQAGTGSWTVNEYAQVFCCDDDALTGGNPPSSIMAETWVRPEDVPSNSYITGQSVQPLAAKKAASLRFNLRKNQALSAVLVAPGIRSSKRTLPRGTWVKFVSAPGASCGLTVKTANKSKSFDVQKAVDGTFVNFSVNRSWVKTNLGVDKGGKVDFVIKCSLGSKKSSTTKQVIVG